MSINGSREDEESLTSGHSKVGSSFKRRHFFIAFGVVATFIFIYLLSKHAATPDSSTTSTLSSSAPTGTTNILDPCLNRTKVNISEVLFLSPNNNLPPPWQRANLSNAILWQSLHIPTPWYALRKKMVKGLKNTTVKDVYDYYMNGSSVGGTANCIMMPWGGAVRDMIIDDTLKTLNDVDAEFSCSAMEALKICKDKWGNDACDLVGARDKLTFYDIEGNGEIPIEAFNWDETFYGNQFQWEYSANSLGLYDDGNGQVYVVDLSGYGLDDLCNRKIRIPVENQNEDSFMEWLKGNVTGRDRPMSKQVSQLLRYWKLRAKDFKTDDQTHNWVVKMLCKNLRADGFLPFYCQTMKGGLHVRDEDNNHYCIVKEENQKAENVQKYTKYFEEDLEAACWKNVSSHINILKYLTTSPKSAQKLQAFNILIVLAMLVRL